ncbi:MAG: peptide ABC transporter ATP-binding protein [Chloroflexi bacterium]|nr:MAG: peptide ABC transporter ATP-binding protein [Chloroflexota bacterium]
MTTLLEVKGLKTRFYTQDGVVHAVNGISYTLDEGETLGIVGESGCGKSVSVLSTMRLIPEPPGKIVGGQVIFEGEDLLKMPMDEIRRVRGNKIAMIFQDPMTSLNPVLTIGRQVEEALELHMGMSRSQARQRAIELLQMVGIPQAEDRIDDYPHQFSGGMRQRVMIAMALSCNPQILIADEPTTALDVTIQAQIVDLVKRLRDEIGMAVIWITHDLGIIAGLADKVIVMYAGYIVETAPVKELYGDPRHPYTIGLLGSLPRLDAHQSRRLVSIEGLPPDLIDLPPGCPFAPRCDYIIDRCLEENPPLEVVGPNNHRIACWVDVKATPKLK